MMPLILLVIGLVARLLDEQVGGQHAVGMALIVIGGILLAIQVLIGAYVTRKVVKTHDEIRSNFGRRL